MSYLWIALVAAAAMFPHCLGMCGAFALHLSAPAPGRTLVRQLLWNAGRTVTYVFLGAIAGFAGASVLMQGALPWLQEILPLVMGGFMVLMGLAVLGLLPTARRRAANKTCAKPDNPGATVAPLAAVPDRKACNNGSPADHMSASGGSHATLAERNGPSSGGLLSSLVAQLTRTQSPAGALVLGLATGFLPCPIVLAFLAWSVQTGSVLSSMLIMAALGVGSSWSLLLLGVTGGAIRIPLRRWAVPAGASILILLGAATMLRGTEMFHQWLGCPHEQLHKSLHQ